MWVIIMNSKDTTKFAKKQPSGIFFEKLTESARQPSTDTSSLNSPSCIVCEQQITQSPIKICDTINYFMILFFLSLIKSNFTRSKDISNNNKV